jgi:hypothetical protein
LNNYKITVYGYGKQVIYKTASSQKEAYLKLPINKRKEARYTKIEQVN